VQAGPPVLEVERVRKEQEPALLEVQEGAAVELRVRAAARLAPRRPGPPSMPARESAEMPAKAESTAADAPGNAL